MEGSIEFRADVSRYLADVRPETLLRDIEAMLVRVGCQLLDIELGHPLIEFFLPDIRNTLEEQKAEDIGLVVR
jgi:hypothetical protein